MMDLELADFESTTATLRAQFEEQTRQLNERSQVLVQLGAYCNEMVTPLTPIDN